MDRSVTSPVHDLTGFQRDCLYVIAGLGPTKGVAIRDELQLYYDSPINDGRLYPDLDVLMEKGLVEKTSMTDRSNSYTLTERGYRELQARREWENNHIDEASLTD